MGRLATHAIIDVSFEYYVANTYKTYPGIGVAVGQS